MLKNGVRTQIVAHRGASADMPENTMEAFIKAKELGAEIVELDVHVLPDGTVVVHHDSELGRCEDAEGSIYQYRRDTVRGKMPLLEEILVYLKENNMRLFCEIKYDAGFCFMKYRHVVELVWSAGMMENTVFISFNHRALRELKRAYPKCKVGALYSETYGIDMVEYCLENSFDVAASIWSLVDGGFVKRAHDKGLEVNVWTIDNAEDINEMAKIGVDYITSNDVKKALEVVGK